jgi:ABC-2 type transport system permease protein
MNVLPVLIRREFWEHRVLWVAPLAVAVLYLAACVFITGIRMGGIDIENTAGPDLPDGLVIGLVGSQLLFTGLLLLLMSVVGFYYLVDCLYAERKDRSILFWKSMPVSDSATVLSKLLVATIVVPVGVVALGLVTNTLGFGILYARFHDTQVMQHLGWSNSDMWLRANVLLLVDVVVFALWYTPFFGYQLLISAWAKNAALAWTVLPPLVLILGEKLLFNTWHLAQLLGYRLGGFTRDLGGAQGFGVSMDRDGHQSLSGMLSNINALPLLTRVDLWIGVVIGAVLIFAAIRIRRYRDDS